MTRVFGYVRVSHQKSADSGLSVESQTKAIQGYADRLPFEWKWGPGKIYVDLAESAYKIPFCFRTQGKQLREELKSGDHVIMYSIDRGFRSVADFSNTIAYWLKEGVSVHLVTENLNLGTATGKLMANVLASFAQFKSDIQSERTRDAMSAMSGKINGKYRERHSWQPAPVSVYKEKDPKPSQGTTKGRVYTYARVSHVLSAASGLSIEAQTKMTNKYAESLVKSGLDRGEDFTDEVVSAFNVPLVQRPGGKALNDSLGRGDHVVVARLDRGWRSIRDLLDTLDSWRERGISCHFADTMLNTNSQAGDVFFKMMALFAEWESELISRKMKEVLAELRSQGRPVNQEKPYWTKVVRRNGKKWLVPCPVQVGMIKRIVHLRKEGMSAQKISDLLENESAAQDSRRPIPRGGIQILGPGLAGKVKLRHREWGPRRILKASEKWPQLRSLLEEWGEDPQSLE